MNIASRIQQRPGKCLLHIHTRGYWTTHFFPVGVAGGLELSRIGRWSSHSLKQWISHPVFNMAVARLPMVSVSSFRFRSIHFRSISRIISIVFLRLFIRNCKISSTGSASSSPSCRYFVDTLVATSSSSSGNTCTLYNRVRGRSCCAE